MLRLSGGRRLRSPPGATTRPTPARVREAVFNRLQSRFLAVGQQSLHGRHWLDLFCGSGAMGCEALRRGAAVVMAVDRDRRALAVAEANLQAVSKGCRHAARFEVVRSDAVGWLKASRPERPFDLIYSDPPYSQSLQPVVAGQVASGGWLRSHGVLILETGREAELGVDWKSLGWDLGSVKRYGGTCVLMLTPRAHCLGSTGTMPPQTGRAASPERAQERSRRGEAQS